MLPGGKRAFPFLQATHADCICILTRGGIRGEISPEYKVNPEGGALGISRGLRLYFSVYPNSSHNTVIINLKKYNSSIVLTGRSILVEYIPFALASGGIFSRIDPALLGL